MAQFKAFARNVEVNGETVLSIVAGMGAFKAQANKVLADCGIADPQPGLWYSQQAWLDAFERLSREVGPKTLFVIGKCIPDNAKFPPAVKDVESALRSIDQAYHMNHRGGEIGVYRYIGMAGQRATMECRNPYPCDFDRGIITGMVTKFKPPSSGAVQVEHEPGRSCRRNGADSCHYVITW